jgi:hypothetical protein
VLGLSGECEVRLSATATRRFGASMTGVFQGSGPSLKNGGVE